jgi:hypothetical protein
MVVRFLAWSCNIYCFVIGLSMGPNMEVGGVHGLIVRLRQSTSLELGKLGELGDVAHLLLCLPLMKYCFLFNKFLVVWLLIALSRAKISFDCKNYFIKPFLIKIASF